MNKLKEKYIKKFIRFLKESNLYNLKYYKYIIAYNSTSDIMPYDFKCYFRENELIRCHWIKFISYELTNDIYTILKDVVDEYSYHQMTKSTLYSTNLKERIKYCINNYSLNTFVRNIDCLGIGYNGNIGQNVSTYISSPTLKYLIYKFNK